MCIIILRVCVCVLVRERVKRALAPPNPYSPRHTLLRPFCHRHFHPARDNDDIPVQRRWRRRSLCFYYPLFYYIIYYDSSCRSDIADSSRGNRNAAGKLPGACISEKKNKHHLCDIIYI